INFNPYVKAGPPSKKELFNFFEILLNIFEQIIENVHRIHEKKIIIGDVAPQNLFHDKEMDKVSMIDFEGSFFENSQFETLKLGNHGFIEDWNQTSNYNSDFRSLGMVLMGMLTPIQALFQLNVDSYSRALKYLEKKRGFPNSIIEIINFLVTNGCEDSNIIYKKVKGKIRNSKETLPNN